MSLGLNYKAIRQILQESDLLQPQDANIADDDTKPELKVDGLFFAADSAITDRISGQPLLGGFRKVYPIKAALWKPYFVGGWFKSYNQIYRETEISFGFSGNTLTAQHVLNFVREHLGKLRISHLSRPFPNPGDYVVLRHCQSNPLDDDSTTWDEDMFSGKDIESLLTADVIADCVEHAINAALKSARKYKISEESLASLYSDFFAGINCPVSGSSRLFSFRVAFEIRDGFGEVFTKKEEVHPGHVLVLGMRSQFEQRAQVELELAIASSIDPAESMFKFLNMAIDEVASQGLFAIDRPSVLHRLNNKGMLRAKWELRE